MTFLTVPVEVALSLPLSLFVFSLLKTYLLEIGLFVQPRSSHYHQKFKKQQLYLRRRPVNDAAVSYSCRTIQHSLCDSFKLLRVELFSASICI